ncbi:uncharacterized protein [Watersipora subatra]|uniref:uncharacterized protein n=1 Tax=Watersipora subatra TaxID=2589382 RepID=UPI00355B5734
MGDSGPVEGRRKPLSVYDKIDQRNARESNTGDFKTGSTPSQPIIILEEDSSESEGEADPPKQQYTFIPPWRRSGGQEESRPEGKSDQRPSKASSSSDELLIVEEQDTGCFTQSYHIPSDVHKRKSSLIGLNKFSSTHCNGSKSIEDSTGSQSSIGSQSYTGTHGSASSKGSIGALSFTSDQIYTDSQVSTETRLLRDRSQVFPTRQRSSGSVSDKENMSFDSDQPTEGRKSGLSGLSNHLQALKVNSFANCTSLKKPSPTKKETRNIAVQTTTSRKDEDSKAQVAADTNQNIVKVNGRPYTVLNLLGKGGSSKVEQVFDFERSQRLALKTVNLVGQQPQTVLGFKKEIEMLKKLEFSERVITLVDYEQSSEHLYLLLECGDTDLAVYLKKKLQDNSLHRMQRCIFWYDMLRAVQVLHDQGIVHSDIKPANFMLVGGEVKLIDFGIAKQLDPEATSVMLESCVGTLNYMSPEVLQGLNTKGVDSKVGRKADVWSLGCILYYMTYGSTPFQSLSSLIAKVTAITNDQHMIDMPDVGEPHLTDTLQLCFQRNYKERGSIEELLSHPYVK